MIYHLTSIILVVIKVMNGTKVVYDMMKRDLEYTSGRDANSRDNSNGKQ